MFFRDSFFFFFLSRCFHEISQHEHIVWKLRNFIAIFSQKFREINFSLKNFILNWFDEKKKKCFFFRLSLIFMDLEMNQDLRVFTYITYMRINVIS